MFHEYRENVFKKCIKILTTYFGFQYCANIPVLVLLEEKDFTKFVSEKRLIQAVNDNILHYHPNAKDTVISNTYARSLAEATGYIDYSFSV